MKCVQYISLLDFFGVLRVQWDNSTIESVCEKTQSVNVVLHV